MNADNTIRFMMAQSGIPAAQASVRLGRSNSFISSTINRGTTPRVDTFAKICDVFGYDLQVVDRATGDVIDVD